MKRIFAIIIGLLCLGTGLRAQTAVQEDLDPQYAADLIAKGQAVPDFTLNDIDGKSVKLSDFRGKTVLLLFWASWCPDCRAEIPQIKAMNTLASPDKVAFVSVSFDRDIDTWKKFVPENSLPGVQLFDPEGMKESKIGEAYHIKWIPSMYVIDPEGKVILGTVMAGKAAAALLGAPSTGTRSLFTNDLCTDENCEN
ncbi:MAG: TlpA family protein disulfide reductase [Bacteroidales bacterium]|nr:TlpA family protein disulfide reductase [Bacteroidales bacterium]